MKTQINKPMPRLVYVVESDKGETITSALDENEARYIGESLAEFDEATKYFLQQHTLN